MNKILDITGIVTLSDLEKARKHLYNREARRKNPYKDPFHPPVGRGEKNKFSKKNINIRDLYERSKNFKFNSYRGVSIKKDSGGKRPLLVPSPEDRIVLTAILPKVINIIIQKTGKTEEMLGVGKKFSQKKIPHIIKEVQDLTRKHGYKYLTKIDFSNFFSTIDRKALLQILKKKYFNTWDTYENTIFNIIKASLHNEISDDGNFFCTEIKRVLRRVGIPQGLPYSPILASIYALELDMLIKDLDGCYIIRYLDDVLILSKTKAQRDTAFRKFRHMAKNKGLKINTKKTEHINFTKQNVGVIFLGVQIVNDGSLVLPHKKKENMRKKLVIFRDNSHQINKHLEKPYYKNSAYYEKNKAEYIVSRKINDSIRGFEQYCCSQNLQNGIDFINEVKRDLL